MNQPVKFDLAKLLKEKEYKNKNVYGTVRLSSEKYYDDEGELHDIVDAFASSLEYKLEDCCNAPTIAEVVMWLYEKHNVWVECLHRGDMGDFTYKVSKLKNRWRTEPHYIHDKGFDSPVKTYEDAIKYILNISI